MKKIVILGGARDFHAMDWYRTVQKNVTTNEVVMLTDLIESEGYTNLVKLSDNIETLFIIDKFLFAKQSTLGNIWRNIFKLVVLPIQVFKLKKFVQKNPDSIFHAHPMYYMLLCWLANVKFIGSPQGDEILVRPFKSKLYKYFSKRVLKAAEYIVVDSINMKNSIKNLSGAEALVYQYGIDIDALQQYNSSNQNKTKITSIRGMLPLYRIEKIIESRRHCAIENSVNFIYPYYEDNYLKNIQNQILSQDADLGRLNKEEMYALLSESYLVISIPKSDSSPRSVYESIFLGCCVAITYNPYIESLPECMKERLFIVDLDDIFWLEKAINCAKVLTEKPYFPSIEAIEMFDQNLSIKRVIDKLYV